MNMAKLQGVCLSLFLVLLAVPIASAGSKQGFAPLDERDLSFYLQKQEKENDPYLYLFSTLSLISRRKDTAVFTIAKSSSTYAMPLVMMEIYPELDMHIQSEFFDFTIWGQLGNYFNKSIEVIELENDILRLLNALKDLNEKYKDLAQTPNPLISRPQKLPTLDKKNYVSVNEEAGREKSSKRAEDPRYASKRGINDLWDKIERYETPGQQERLRSNPTSQKPQPDVFAQRSYTTASSGTAGSPRNVDASGLEGDDVFIRLLNGFVALVTYLIDNKIETCIYLYILFSFGAFFKVLLKR